MGLASGIGQKKTGGCPIAQKVSDCFHWLIVPVKLIAELMEDGLITDSGEGKGFIKHVRVCRLKGL